MTDQELAEHVNSTEIMLPIEPKPALEPNLVQYYYELGELYYSIGKPHEGDIYFASARAAMKIK